MRTRRLHFVIQALTWSQPVDFFKKHQEKLVNKMVMDITFIGHASILIETRGVQVLSDPGRGEPFFEVNPFILWVNLLLYCRGVTLSVTKSVIHRMRMPHQSSKGAL